MADLDANGNALSMVERDDPGQASDLPVFPDAEAAGRDASLRRDARGLQHRTADTREREARVMRQMPGLHMAVDGLVLAHGRKHDAVREGHSGEAEGGEQAGHGLGWHGWSCSSLAGQPGLWSGLILLI